jgi:hypothetical protein
MLAGTPEVDIVFVHGIRGGPFASWRSGVCPEGEGSQSCSHEYCWPNQWLAPDVPQARLLSLEYAAPASGWEVLRPFPSLLPSEPPPSPPGVLSHGLRFSVDALLPPLPK